MCLFIYIFLLALNKIVFLLRFSKNKNYAQAFFRYHLLSFFIIFAFMV